MEKNITVLVVDDDFATLRIQSKMLSRIGYQVCTSPTAVDIFSIIERYAPDIILMDQDMPFVSGMEAIKQIKSHERYRSIPVIHFSLHENLSELAKEAGADAYVSKASTIEYLAESIDRLIRLSSKSKS